MYMVMCVCDFIMTGTKGHSESETITDHLESLTSDMERVRPFHYTRLVPMYIVYTYVYVMINRFVANHLPETTLWNWLLLMITDK